MRKQTKSQQIQFFEYCLLPTYEAETTQIDLRAEIDSSLTTSENWQRLDSRYNISGQQIEQYEYKEAEYIASQIRSKTEKDPQPSEIINLDEEVLESTSDLQRVAAQLSE